MFRAIYHKRSQLKNYKVKKHHQRGGGVFYTVWYRSIFGWWRSFREYDGYSEGGTHRITYDTADKAKEAIRDRITSNVMWLGQTVKEIEEIRFD